MEKIKVAGTIENVQEVLDLVDKELVKYGCAEKTMNEINVAIDEIFSNIANYAYNPGMGEVMVQVEVIEDPLRVTISFIDEGIPYNPLLKEDPDVTLRAEERKIGGLGVFIVKKLMDKFEYEYNDNHNIQRITKIIK